MTLFNPFFSGTHPCTRSCRRANAPPAQMCRNTPTHHSTLTAQRVAHPYVRFCTRILSCHSSLFDRSAWRNEDLAVVYVREVVSWCSCG